MNKANCQRDSNNYPERYVGRFVAVGKTTDGRNIALYRVSSRSFPSREAKISPAGQALIVPKPGYESDLQKNPYIAYACGIALPDWGIVSNGSHTAPIAEKIAMGVPVRDALASVLLAMDYEKDTLDTPRIAAVMASTGDTGYLGIVRRDGLEVSAVTVQPGQCRYIATYEENYLSSAWQCQLQATDADAICSALLGDEAPFQALQNPVTAVTLLSENSGWQIATKDRS